MLLYYIRHGDPIYNPDSLTPQGEQQAEALSKRLALCDFDKIYVSTSNRAYLTAKPTLEKLGREPVRLDWLNENHAWEYFSVDGMWAFQSDYYRKLFTSNEIRALGHNWHKSGKLSDTHFAEGVRHMRRDVFGLMAEQGYVHSDEENCYLSEGGNDKKIAVFAHQGIGMAFLSTLLDIPYPMFCTHFDLSHSSMTVIEFSPEQKSVIPVVLQLSNDSHIYREGLSRKYNNMIEI